MACPAPGKPNGGVSKYKIGTQDAYGIENLTWTPQVRFAGNTVRNNRARGALFSTPRRTVAEDNLFDHTSGTAILLCGDCNGWYETGACRDVLIRRNTDYPPFHFNRDTFRLERVTNVHIEQ